MSIIILSSQSFFTFVDFYHSKKPLFIILLTKTLFKYYHSSKKIEMLKKLCQMATALFVADYFGITFL